jgi:phosphatidylinositol glycan class S
MAEIMRTVASQVRKLFGLSAAPPAVAAAPSGVSVLSLPSPISALAQWEVDVMTRRQAGVAHDKAAESLIALAEVVQALPNILVMESIRAHVLVALEAMYAARAHLAAAHYQEASYEATRAHTNAETAFFHPTILPMIYFPGEQKLAVYLPMMFPMLVSVAGRCGAELVRYFRRRRAAMAFKSP